MNHDGTAFRKFRNFSKIDGKVRVILVYVCVQCMSVLSIRRRGLSSDRNSVWRPDLLLASPGKVVSSARFHQPKPEISHLLQHTEYYEGLFFLHFA